MKSLLLITLLNLIIISTNTKAADEGIKVHGHWKFEIYNPDGSFDKKVEFQNSLENLGAQALLRMLNKESSVGRWIIELSTANGSNERICKDAAGNVNTCLIVEAGNGGGLPYQFENLMVGLDDVNNPTKLILSGSVTAAQGLPATAGISRVTTYIKSCKALFTPNCELAGLGFSTEFTRKTLTSAVTISSGQIVQVTVEISFS